MKNIYAKLSLFALCAVYVLIMHWVDKNIAGPEMTFTLIYLVPISAIAWFTGMYYGAAVGLLCSLSWLDVYVSQGHDRVTITNIAVKFTIFVSYAVLVGKLKAALEREKEISRTDNLTGLANSKAFLDALNREINRSTRYERVLSMIYMDLDNFKAVNDDHGHNVGDKALKETAKVLNSVFRSSDTIARMGGDEFAVLLPEADNVSAMEAAGKLSAEFKKMSAMEHWPISLSIGVATFMKPLKDSDMIIKHADKLMYAAKRNGKNNIQTGVIER